MASYIALHDYAATDTDEVTLQEGDSIFEVTAVAGSEGWLSGKVERTGATGSFPESYVELAAEPAASAGSAGTDASAPTVTAAEAWTALYDYAATEGDEVSFNEGDFLTNVKTYTDGWLTGTVTRTGESGSFPEAYAEKATTTTAAAAAAPAPASESARDAATDGGGGGGWVALYDYSATEQDEVSFNEGDALADVKAYTDGWLTGTVVRTGASGSFPETYVEKAASPGAAAPAPASAGGGGEGGGEGGGVGNYTAIYDYTATDTDEVTFVEGDAFKDVTPYTEGWLSGTVVRTGAYGSFPETYAKPSSSAPAPIVPAPVPAEVAPAPSPEPEPAHAPEQEHEPKPEPEPEQEQEQEKEQEQEQEQKPAELTPAPAPAPEPVPAPEPEPEPELELPVKETPAPAATAVATAPASESAKTEMQPELSKKKKVAPAVSPRKKRAKKVPPTVSPRKRKTKGPRATAATAKTTKAGRAPVSVDGPKAGDELDVLCCTVNAGAAHMSPSDMAAWIPKEGLRSDGSAYDVITIGFQQYLAAPPNIAPEAGVEADEVQHIASPLKQWLGSKYTLVTSEHNPQMMLRVYVKTTLAGNGGLAIKVVVRSSSLCFVGCDLSSEPEVAQPSPASSAADVGAGADAGAGAGAGGDDAGPPQPPTRRERLARRNADAADVIGPGAAIGRPELDLASQFDHTFCMGTLGYQIDMKRLKWFPKNGSQEEEWNILSQNLEHIRSGGAGGDDAEASCQTLQAADELACSQADEAAFVSWNNPRPSYLPTYKVAPGVESESYSHEHTPSYSDRVLWTSLQGLDEHIALQLHESCPGYTSSDHKPVRAGFRVRDTPARPELGQPVAMDRVLFELSGLKATLAAPAAQGVPLNVSVFTDPAGLLLPASPASMEQQARKTMRRKLSWSKPVDVAAAAVGDEAALAAAAFDFKMQTQEPFTAGGAAPTWESEILLSLARLLSPSKMTTAYMHVLCSSGGATASATDVSVGSASIHLREVYLAAENGWPYTFDLPLVSGGKVTGAVKGALLSYYLLKEGQPVRPFATPIFTTTVKPSAGKRLGIIVQDLGDDRGIKVQGFDASVGGKPPKGTAIQAGDLILSVNGKKVSTLKVEEVAASLLSGFDAVELELGRRYIGFKTMVITRPGGKGPIGLHITDSGTGKCELLHSVGAGSPAEAAGATPGSLVVEIDGANVERMSHDQLIATLKASGEQLVLTVASSYNTAGAGAAGAAGAGAGASNGELPDYLPQRVEAGAIIASITPARTVPSMSKLGADDVPVFSPISAMKALPDTPVPTIPSPLRAHLEAAMTDGVPLMLAASPVATRLFTTVDGSPSKLGSSNASNSLRFVGLHTITVQRSAEEPYLGFVLHDAGGMSGCQIVHSVTDGGAAERAGVQLGEMLVTVGAVNVDGLSHNDTIKVLGGSDPAAPLQLQFAKQYISNPQAVVSLEMKRKPRGGWGMAVKALPNGGVSVTTVKRGSPAAVAGVKVDDFLMQIDRADVANKPNTQVVGMLKGAGKTCVVAVRRSLSTVVTPRGGGSLGLTLRSEWATDRLVVDAVSKKGVCGGKVTAGSILWAIDGRVLSAEDHQVVADHVIAGNAAGRAITLDFMPLLPSKK